MEILTWGVLWSCLYFQKLSLANSPFQYSICLSSFRQTFLHPIIFSFLLLTFIKEIYAYVYKLKSIHWLYLVFTSAIWTEIIWFCFETSPVMNGTITYHSYVKDRFSFFYLERLHQGFLIPNGISVIVHKNQWETHSLLCLGRPNSFPLSHHEFSDFLLPCGGKSLETEF